MSSKTNSRIHTILSVLEKNKICSYTELYDKLRENLPKDTSNHKKGNISHRDFTLYLKKAEEKQWIYSHDRGKRGTKISIEITDIGSIAHKYNISFEEYDEYFRSTALLCMLLGVGIRYDWKKLSTSEIKDIQIKSDYTSISMDDITRRVLDNNNRLFGYMDLNRFTEKGKNGIVVFLEDKGIIKYNVKTDRYIIENKEFSIFFSKCWGMLHDYTLRIMLDFVYTCLRKPNALEKEWLKTLFGRKWVSVLERSYHQERSFRKSILNSGQEIDQRYKLIDGISLLRKITNYRNNLFYYKKHMEEQYLSSITEKHHQQIMQLLLTLIFPSFLLESDFKKLLSIKENGKYLIPKSFTS